MREVWARLPEPTRIALGMVLVIVVAAAAIGITALVLSRESASPRDGLQAPAVYELQAWASGSTSIAVSWSCDLQGATDATPPAGTARLLSQPTTLYRATGGGLSCTVTKQEVGTVVVQLYRNGSEVDSVNSGVQDGQAVHVGS